MEGKFKGCKGCIYWRPLTTNSDNGRKTYACHYILDTGYKRGFYPAINCYQQEGTPYTTKKDIQEKRIKKERSTIIFGKRRRGNG